MRNVNSGRTGRSYRYSETPFENSESCTQVNARHWHINICRAGGSIGLWALAGEELIVLAEQRRLHDAGKRILSNRVEHVSRTKGDGLGYDIMSFELDGRERLIEVKTTAFGKTTPFFASRREVQVSVELGLQYHLYRLFKFRDAPKAFILNGSLRETCRLDPTIFAATAR